MALDDVQAKINQSRRDFDIDDGTDAAVWVEALTGDSDVTDPADAYVPDGMSLDTAAGLVGASRTAEVQFYRGILERKLSEFSAKAEDFKATQDSRTLHANMALGIKTVLLEWGAADKEAFERVQQATPDEKRKMNKTVRDAVDASPATSEGPTKGFVSDRTFVYSLDGMRVVYAEPQSKR